MRRLAIQNRAASVKIGAERRAGVLLERMDLKAGRPKTGNPSTLKALGIGELQSHRWQTMAAVPDAEVKRLEAELTGAERELTSAAG